MHLWCRAADGQKSNLGHGTFTQVHTSGQWPTRTNAARDYGMARKRRDGIVPAVPAYSRS